MTQTYLNILLALARRRFDVVREICRSTPALQEDRNSIIQQILKEFDRIRMEAKFEVLNEVLHDSMRLEGKPDYVNGVIAVEEIITAKISSLEKEIEKSTHLHEPEL